MHKNPVYIKPDDPEILLIKGSIELGMPVSILGQVLMAFPTDPPIPIAVLRYVFGPLIFHVADRGESGLGWLTRDILAEWRPRVDLERIEILCGERPDLVSPAEIWLVLYNATHDAPMRSNLTAIYLWASRRALLGAGKEAPGRVFDNTAATDEEVFEGRYAQDYRFLCREIITKVTAQSRLRMRRAKA